MYFVRSGYTSFVDSSIRGASYNGRLWSATAYSADSRYAFYLLFNSTNTYLSDNHNRHPGFPLQKTYLNSSPMYFVRSGRIYLTTASLQYAGNPGAIWSSTTHVPSSQYAYSPYLASTSAMPSYSYSRFVGLSLRNFLQNPLDLSTSIEI